MFNIITLLATAVAGTKIVKEKLEPTVPAGTRFDWDAYWEDIRNGMDCQTQIKKQQRGGYNTTAPKKPEKRQLTFNEWRAINEARRKEADRMQVPMDAIVDVERYKKACEKYGKEEAEINRKNGYYRYIAVNLIEL